MSDRGVHRLLQLCQKALTRQGHERDAFLDEACAGDTELRRAVDALLAEQFSPDGRWIAYASNESGGRLEIYVVSFPELTSKRQVSADGGTSPVWDRQGRILYYLQNGYLVAHEVRLGTEFSKGRATRLFATRAQTFDVAPGNRFLMVEPNTAPPDNSLHPILNWFEELKAKVPVRP
jgi:tricorn protease-like protein